VLKLSALSTHACFDPRTPPAGGCVSDALLCCSAECSAGAVTKFSNDKWR